jgi:hypothetical protein
MTASGNRGPAKFRLGKNLKQAERRLQRIMQLWEHIEAARPSPVWSDFEWRIAKLYEKGELQVPIPRNEEDNPHSYATSLHYLCGRYPMVNFVPADVQLYGEGLAFNRQAIDHQLTALQARGLVPTVQVSLPSGCTLHKAMDAYIGHIKKDYFDSSEGHVNDNGMTKIRQVRTMMERLEDKPLSMLDLNTCDELFQYFRHRPLTKQQNKPMTKKSCQNYVGELNRFFEWLDGKYEWMLPEKFHRLKRTVDDLEADAEHDAKDIPVFTIDQLQILNRYATPLERLFLLLGLNGAFGADQIGRLRIGEVIHKKGRTFIVRLRRKRKVQGRHLLWKQTVEGVEWAMEQRKLFAVDPTAKNILIVNANGKPYWSKTKSGNRARSIPNRWQDLLKRIRVDHPDFPRLPFNSVRDTSIDMVRQLAGESMASLHATHKHQSSDKNLRRYSNPRWKRLFKIHFRLERKLASVFEAAPANPFDPQPQAYVSQKVLDRIKELDAAGVGPTKIAAYVGLHYSTERRKLQQSNAD